jgi:hypothetical protein
MIKLIGRVGEQTAIHLVMRAWLRKIGDGKVLLRGT